MQKRSDDRLVDYIDGELEMAEQREVEAWLDADPAARERFAALAASTNLVRLAFDEVMHEPVPDRLIAAARGEMPVAPAAAQILPFKRSHNAERSAASRRWIGLAAAASL